MNAIKIFNWSILMGITLFLNGQNVLTKNEAVAITLENNFGIKLAKNEIEIAENNASRELNGYLPTVDASVGPSASFGGSTQNFNSGMSAEVRNAFSWTAGASVVTNYTLYDQSRDFRLEQLQQIVGLSDLQLRLNIETTLFQLYNQYFYLAQLTENLRAFEETLKVSEKRLERSRLRYEYSQGTRLDVLNAEVDVDRDSINYHQVRMQLANARRDLNVLMGASVEADFEIDPGITYLEGISKEQFLEEALTNNTSLLISDQNQVINEIDLRIIDSVKKPKIGTYGTLAYNYQGNAPGSFITSSSATSLTVGVSLNWNIFDGGRRKVLEQNNRLTVESQSIFKEQITQEIERDIANAWEAYQNALFVLDVEENSLETNHLNLQRTEELFNSGQVSSVEFRQAQLNLLNAETGFNSAKFDVKLRELELIYLSGGILKSQ